MSDEKIHRFAIKTSPGFFRENVAALIEPSQVTTLGLRLLKPGESIWTARAWAFETEDRILFTRALAADYPQGTKLHAGGETWTRTLSPTTTEPAWAPRRGGTTPAITADYVAMRAAQNRRKPEEVVIRVVRPPQDTMKVGPEEYDVHVPGQRGATHDDQLYGQSFGREVLNAAHGARKGSRLGWTDPNAAEAYKRVVRETIQRELDDSERTIARWYGGEEQKPVAFGGSEFTYGTRLFVNCPVQKIHRRIELLRLDTIGMVWTDTDGAEWTESFLKQWAVREDATAPALAGPTPLDIDRDGDSRWLEPPPLVPTVPRPAREWQEAREDRRAMQPCGFGILLDLPTQAEMTETNTERVMRKMRADLLEEARQHRIFGTTESDRHGCNNLFAVLGGTLDERIKQIREGAPRLEANRLGLLKMLRSNGIGGANNLVLVAPQSSTVQRYRKPRR